MSAKDSNPRPGMTLPRWALPVAGIVVLGLVAAVAVLFIRGSSGDPATPAAAAVEAPRGPSAEYVTAVQAPIGRLTDSAQVTGRVLTRASGEEDVAGVGRMATQQLAVVQNARARIAEIETGPRERAARGALSRATQAHRTYLASLARLADADAETAPDRVPQIRTQARRMLERYRLLFTELPTVPKGITTAGVGDISGLRQALTARQRAAEQAAEEAGPPSERQRRPRSRRAPLGLAARAARRAAVRSSRTSPPPTAVPSSRLARAIATRRPAPSTISSTPSASCRAERFWRRTAMRSRRPGPATTSTTRSRTRSLSGPTRSRCSSTT